MKSELSVRCGAKTKAGTPCKQWAIQGGTRCRKHGGAAPQVRAKAEVRAEVMRWGLGDATVDPGEVLLRLVAQSAARAARYADELEKAVEEHGFITAMVGESMVATQFNVHKSGEYIRALAKLEAEERDRCANFAAKAIAAGLNERMVRVAERQGEMLAGMVTAALAEAALPPEMAQRVRASIARQVRELTS